MPTTSFKPGRVGCQRGLLLSVDRSLGPQNESEGVHHPKRKTNITNSFWCIVHLILLYHLIHCDNYITFYLSLHRRWCLCPTLPSHSISSPNWKRYSPRNLGRQLQVPIPMAWLPTRMETEKPELDGFTENQNKMHDGCKTTKLFGLQVKSIQKMHSCFNFQRSFFLIGVASHLKVLVTPGFLE